MSAHPERVPRGFTRREALFGILRRPATAEPAPSEPVQVEGAAKVAVIQGRHCLAYRNLACSVCAERCPEPGAILREKGIPRVVADACTGCGVCRDVCPAPTNAVLVLGARPPLGGPGR